MFSPASASFTQSLLEGPMSKGWGRRGGGADVRLYHPWSPVVRGKGEIWGGGSKFVVSFFK